MEPRRRQPREETQPGGPEVKRTARCLSSRLAESGRWQHGRAAEFQNERSLSTETAIFREDAATRVLLGA